MQFRTYSYPPYASLEKRRRGLAATPLSRFILRPTVEKGDIFLGWRGLCEKN